LKVLSEEVALIKRRMEEININVFEIKSESNRIEEIKQKREKKLREWKETSWKM
jgi:hypothetical protein